MTAFLPYELAIEFLRRPQIQLAPYLTLERVERALASSGAGLDHLAGERPLALGEDSDGQFTNFFLLTDRRLAGRNDAHFRQAHAFQIEHAAITGVAYEPGFRKLDQQSDHVTLPSLRIFAGDTIVDATIPAFIEPLGQYVAAISQIVAEDRSPSIRPPTEPTDDDPTGAEVASRTLQAWSPRCSRMLQLISNGVRRRLLPLETGRDLAARVVLLYRTMVFGRGMTNGWWSSPLSAGDLRYAILMVMGRPVQEFQRDEIYCAYFEVSGGSGASKAAASSAAGLAALALFGAGWVSIPRRTKQTIRVAITGAPSHSTFNLSLVAGPRLFSLSSVNPEMLRSVWSALVQHEDQLMFMRCAFGWGSPADQLVNLPESVVAARLRQFE
jgi:hypothetical protein